MKVGIIGSGDVAKSLANGFLKHGHVVTMGTRTTKNLEQWARLNPGIRLGSFAEAAKLGEVIVLAVKGTAATEALRMAVASNLTGKVVVDATNPIADKPPINGY